MVMSSNTMKADVERSCDDGSKKGGLKSRHLTQLAAIAISFLLGRITSGVTVMTRSCNVRQAVREEPVDRAHGDGATSNANETTYAQANKLAFDDGATSKAKETTYFAQANKLAFDRISNDAHSSARNQSGAALFNLAKWKAGTGGLTDKDRIKLASIYGNATSVFEYGLGESTKIANAVRVPRYAGIDSDANWVALAAESVSDHYRFYLANIGPTRMWGFPIKPHLVKNVYQYQMAPLVAEPDAFDVYMVDGRYRFPCLLASFLHAAARGAKRSHTTVLLHDCMETKASHRTREPKRRVYRTADELFHLDHSGGRLCIFKRRENTTDEMLFDLWKTHMSDLS
jgi:hypothetical protein